MNPQQHSRVSEQSASQQILASDFTDVKPENPLERFKAKLLELKERLIGITQVAAPVVAEAIEPEAGETNVVEAMLAEVPNLSHEGRERIRGLFPDGKVCCPIRVARAIQLELLRENSKGLIKFT